jgi:adenine-specific DNA-methyltransferase
MPRRPSPETTSTATRPVSDYRHDDARRKNNPPAGLAAHGRVRPAAGERYAYDPHLPPALRFDSTGRAEYLDELIGRAIGGTLSEEDGALLRELLGSGAPWLEWAGKREAQEFVVDPVALHIHERVSTQAILSTLRRDDVQRDLFADPQQEYGEAVRFYEHDVDWSNRMILGDSLQIMASLAHREDLAGKVQMIYMDPPYGIRFASNFQPEIGRKPTAERDRSEDLTRQPEMIRAFRDTWQLGVHSYLTYLRDRLILCRELLNDAGSLFLQMGDENLHRVTLLLDEVFGASNHIVTIVVQKKGSQKGDFVQPINDYVIWYTKNREAAAPKFRRIYQQRKTHARISKTYRLAELATGECLPIQLAGTQGQAFASNPLTSGGERTNQSLPYEFEGRVYKPGTGSCWKTTARPVSGVHSGMDRLARANRLYVGKGQLRFKSYVDDFVGVALTNFWTGLGGAPNPKYVVETNPKIIERCLLMTTAPGDLVIDPTCGSGTTALVAEQWGRRWITMDTSRVALALARQRLLTATFPHFAVTDDDATDGKANPGRGFNYRTVPHITLKSIAQNVALDPIFGRHQKVLDRRLGELNDALRQVTPELRKQLKRRLADKQKQEGKRAITDSDRRRWLLPAREWREWEVPFDADEDWPEPLREALVAFREAWRAKMDEVNETIAASADQEELVDQPEVEKGVVRVAGPFTMEAVMPAERGDGAGPGFAGGPEDDLETFDADDAVNAEAFVDRMLRLLAGDGVRFPDNRTMRFAQLERIEAGAALHGEGEWANGDGGTRRVVISIGPEHGPVTAYQVEEALREANRRGADDLVFAGFAFDGAAQAAIQDDPHPRVRAHLAHIAPDVQMGSLLKTTSDSQLFSVFGLPRAELSDAGGGEWAVEMQGVDIYDPVKNTIHATRADKVAAWFLDADYDGRTFCITQAFFPERSAWKKLERALRGTIDAERFEDLTGTASLPFKAGKHQRVAVKVIDPRGNEVMRVLRLPS